MKGLIILFQWLMNFLLKVKTFIPPGIVAIFVVSNFLFNLREHGLIGAFKIAAEVLFAAETKINEIVNLAISNSPEYGIGAVFQLIGALFTVYLFLKWITKGIQQGPGAQSLWGSVLFAFFALFLIELTAIAILHGKIDFIPIFDGLIFMIIHLDVLFANFHIFGVNVTEPILEGQTIDTIEIPMNY